LYPNTSLNSLQEKNAENRKKRVKPEGRTRQFLLSAASAETYAQNRRAEQFIRSRPGMSTRIKAQGYKKAKKPKI
jgi:hypothetical protein